MAAITCFDVFDSHDCSIHTVDCGDAVIGRLVAACYFGDWLIDYFFAVGSVESRHPVEDAAFAKPASHDQDPFVVGKLAVQKHVGCFCFGVVNLDAHRRIFVAVGAVKVFKRCRWLRLCHGCILGIRLRR